MSNNEKCNVIKQHKNSYLCKKREVMSLECRNNVYLLFICSVLWRIQNGLEHSATIVVIGLLEV